MPHAVTKYWKRDLTTYPTRSRRWLMLALIVVSGASLMSLNLVGGAISPLLMKDVGMSTNFYSGLLVASAVVGAITSYFSAISDRIGRANLIVYGSLIAGLIGTFGVPTAHTKWAFAFWFILVGFADGVAFVGGSAMVRDFSPQTGRATAMGINTLTIGLAALGLSFGASRLLVSDTADWRVMLHLTGGACIAVGVLTMFLLRDLPASLRAKVIVSADEGHRLDQSRRPEDAASENPGNWRSVLTPKLVLSNLAIMLYLVVFITAANFLTLYTVEVHHFTVGQANELNTLYWAAACVSPIVFGLLSDRLGARRPVMFLGAGLVVVALILLMTTEQPTYWQLTIPLLIWAVGMGGGFSPWFAAYSEDAEAVDPRLVGTAFAAFSVANKLSGVVAGLTIPFVIGSPATAAGWRYWFLTCIVMMVAFVALCAFGLKGARSLRRSPSPAVAG
ncbi:MFS transporter [Streptomyces sp. Lzd4kr]|nr:MFS transporter [Streptomyces sp. Lzd4kr]